MARTKKSLFYDKLHRRAVQSIWAFSGLCTVLFGIRFYNFKFNVSPALRAEREIVEAEFLAEGKPTQEDLSAT